MKDGGRFRVLIIGGYGTFSSRLVELLSDEPRLTIFVAGRSLEKAQALCRKYDASVRLCLALGIDYLDFADGSAFARGISRFDAEARARGIFVLSAVSSSPALSAAALRELARGMSVVEHVDGGIAPSPFAGIGLNVIRAIASYAGKPLKVLRDGKRVTAWGLTQSRRVTICPPGSRPLTSRTFALVDVPDLELLPAAMPELKSVWFGAGTAPQLYLRMLMALAWLARWKLLPGLSAFAGLFHAVANRLSWGEHRGGMFVRVRGRDGEGRAITRSWHLIAEGDTGPSVPAMAIDAVIRKCLDGHHPETGARAATEELTLADFKRGFAVKNIVTGIREEPDPGEPLYRRILGAAWHELPEKIRDLHVVETSRRFGGKARVDRGSGLIARLIGSLYRFPHAGTEIPVSVLLERRGDGELWERTFAGRTFRSWQWEGRGRSHYLIDERFGPVCVGLALVTGERRLEYVVRRWRFLGLPMPIFLAPGGRTYEFVEDDRFHFHVEIVHPWFGLIVRYRGWLEDA